MASDNATKPANLTSDLLDHGLMVMQGAGIFGSLVYERPVYVFDPRCIKHCSLGAFALINGYATTSIYRTRLGRYAQVGESVVLGPPEHPQDWFSSHPFAFTRPEELPNMYRMAEFRRLAPDGSEAAHYTDTVPSDTDVGHEAYVGAGSFVKRGVKIGDGAVVGAQSVVTRDVPPYAIVAGAPAKIVRMRFAEQIIERFLALQWWHYDLAPHKHKVDFSQVEATLDYFEQQLADGTLDVLTPKAYRLTPMALGKMKIKELDRPLYAPGKAEPIALPGLGRRGRGKP